MNRNPQSQFDLSSPLLRRAFALAAVAATLATLGFIDALAHGYGPLFAQQPPVVVAQR